MYGLGKLALKCAPNVIFNPLPGEPSKLMLRAKRKRKLAEISAVDYNTAFKVYQEPKQSGEASLESGKEVRAETASP